MWEGGDYEDSQQTESQEMSFAAGDFVVSSRRHAIFLFLTQIARGAPSSSTSRILSHSNYTLEVRPF